MQKMSLREIQLVGLNMMKDVHQFCVENGIRYTLAYGSLIGAIRHKGFIPWDDDIDIWMPRPDFERFSKEYVSEKGYTLSSVYDNDTYINYTRVYDNDTYVKSPGISAKYPTGIWIDIFPIDGISDDEKISNDQFQRLRFFTRRVMLLRGSLGRLHTFNMKNNCKALLRLVQLYLPPSGNFRYWHQRIVDICKEYDFGKTRKCSSLVCVEANRKNKQEIFDVNDFGSFFLMPFEDTFFYVACGYDHILKTIFGDYMIIPPKDKQVSHLINQWGFYWK